MLRRFTSLGFLLLAALSVNAFDVSNPLAQDDYFSTSPGKALSANVLLNDSDPDGDYMVPVIAENPTHGTVQIDVSGNFYYQPVKKYLGKDQFTYDVYDENGGAASAQVNIQIEDLSCAEPKLFVLLEGAYDEQNNYMKTGLKDKGLLPGMDNDKKETDIKPYATAPWNFGTKEYDFKSDIRQAHYIENAVDWILVSLLDENYMPLVRTKALVKSNGEISFQENCFVKLKKGQAVFVKIEHRNHTSVISSEKVVLQDGMLSYDFRTQDSALTKDPQQKITDSGYWVMYAGNGSQTEDVFNTINKQDRTIWTEANGMFNTYQNADYNLDGDVNVLDKIVWYNNQQQETE